MYTIGWIDTDGGVYALTVVSVSDALYEIRRIENDEYELGIGVQCATVEAFINLMMHYASRTPFASDARKAGFTWLRDATVEYGIDENHVVAPFLKYAHDPKEGR